ncbi:MAG: hypothetical protein CMO42_07555 [Verrucomicrobiales bacterium]|nr:hypothetical protein [Verrucomicrobiales bacterium]
MISFFAYLLMSFGLFFVTIGVLGLIRFSNIFQRMHALSVMETLGFFCFFLGLMILAGASLLALKLFFIFVLMMIIAPTSTHVLAMYARLYEEKFKGEKLSNHL